MSVKYSVIAALSCLAFAVSAQAEASVMKDVAKSVERTNKLPEGFTKKNIAKPELRGTPFGQRLNVLTRKKVKDWKELVMSDEFDHLTPEKREYAANNPTKYLKVPYLL